MVHFTINKMLAFSFCLALIVGTHVSFTCARPAPDQVAAMAEALKMLQQLDKHYAQIAKPRLRSDPTRRNGNSGTRQDISRLLHLMELDRQYSHLTKPRFGRSLSPHPMHDVSESDPSMMRDGFDEYRR